MAVPISITPFLASHLDKALETPSPHTIGPIFKILSGIGSHLLDALPSDLVARLQEQFKKLLQTVGTQQHMTDLVCLAVLAITASIIESLRLCQTIVDTIDAGDRRLWMENDRGKLRKLVEKVSSYDRRSKVLCMALHFITSLVGDRSLPHELLPVCKAVLCAPLASSLDHTVGVKILLLLDETTIQDHLIAILQAAILGYASPSKALETESALVVINSFTASLECSASLRHKLLNSLSTNVLAEIVSRHLDLTQINHSSHDDHNDYCPYAYAQGRTRLQHKICTLFLKAALFSQQDTVGLDTSLGSAMLDKLVALNTDIPACRRYPTNFSSRKPALVALLEAESTPQSTAGSSQWRERIRRDLTQNAEYQYQTIIRTLGESCQDLERRCNDVERPLREEQANVRRLHNLVDASKARIAELEVHNHEQNLFLEGVEHEKAEFVEHIRSLENEVESLSNQMGKLRPELEGTIRRADDAAQNNTNTIKELELVHAAVVAEKDEIIESLHVHKLDLGATVGRLEASTAELRAKEIVTGSELAQLRATLSDQRTALDRANIIVDEKEAECGKRKESADHLQAEKSDLQDQLQEIIGTYRAIEEERQAGLLKIEAQSVALAELRQEHDTVLSAQEEKMIQLHQLHDERMQELQVYIKEQAKDAAKSVEESDQKVRHLEDRASYTRPLNFELAKLAGEVESRENELEEARGLTDQVMAFWNKQRPRNVPTEGRLVSERGISRGNSVDSNPPYQEHAAASSRNRMAPTAKRSRKHQHLDSPKPPSKNQARPSVGATRTTSAARGKATPFRRPLQELQCGMTSEMNVSPVGGRLLESTPKMSLDAEGHDENVDLEMTGVSLCDSDFFGSADQQLLAGVRGEMAQNTSDDTTVEF
ncbi:MAG: hypothetical protein LQ344_003942 [Seirophora lacunosa]|nr:MAG: hypothetical protein LQ344_003942 [Seirophora lacunosa]